jgi:hypothetical protein
MRKKKRKMDKRGDRLKDTNRVGSTDSARTGEKQKIN